MSITKKTNWQTKKQIISEIPPKTMVEVFDKNPAIQAKTIVEKHYLGLWIKVTGIVKTVDTMLNYVTFNFEDEDHVYISANFSKPISGEISTLNKGDNVNLVGQVFNVGENIVVLDNCELMKEGNFIKEDIARDNSKNKEWYEKWWGILILGIIASTIVAIIFYFYEN